MQVQVPNEVGLGMGRGRKRGTESERGQERGHETRGRRKTAWTPTFTYRYYNASHQSPRLGHVHVDAGTLDPAFLGKQHQLGLVSVHVHLQVSSARRCTNGQFYVVRSDAVQWVVLP